MSLSCPAALSEAASLSEATAIAAPPPVPAPGMLGLADAACELGALLDRAAQLSATEAGSDRWRHLRADAAQRTGRLAADGAVPSHLVVGAGDPPIVVERSLLALSRHVDRLYAASHTGRSAWESSTTADD